MVVSVGVEVVVAMVAVLEVDVVVEVDLQLDPYQKQEILVEVQVVLSNKL